MGILSRNDIKFIVSFGDSSDALEYPGYQSLLHLLKRRKTWQSLLDKRVRWQSVFNQSLNNFVAPLFFRIKIDGNWSKYGIAWCRNPIRQPSPVESHAGRLEFAVTRVSNPFERVPSQSHATPRRRGSKSSIKARRAPSVTASPVAAKRS